MKFLNYDRVLCLSPHPDDVEYGMVGSMYKFRNTQFDVLILSEGGDFDESTGKFTAPVTGRYMFFTAMHPEGITSSHTQITCQIVTSNDYADVARENPYVTGITSLVINGTYFADMDANDTAYVRLALYNGSKVIDVTTAARFGGWLVC